MSNWSTYPLNMRLKVPKSAGLYCIYHKNKLVYLASTTDLRGRLRFHVTPDGYVIGAKYSKTFHTALVADCFIKVKLCVGDISGLAHRLLKRLKPSWNYKTGKPSPPKKVKFVSPKLSPEEFAEVRAELLELKALGCTNNEAARHLRFRGRKTLRGKQWNASAAAIHSSNKKAA